MTRDPGSACPVLRWVILAALGLGLLAWPGCGEEPVTALRLTVEFTTALDQLKISLQSEGETGPAPRLVPEAATAIWNGLRVLLLVPDAWDGRNVTLNVTGLSQGKDVAHGTNAAKVYRDKVTEVLVELETCSDVCVSEARECVGDSYRKCEKNSLGCASWSVPVACPSNAPFCSNGLCSATCTNECTTTGEKRCAPGGTAGIQVCGNHDLDSCLDWGPVLLCQSTEICSLGSCVPSCEGKPCSCQPTQTQNCADTGECKGGVRKCINGTFGACEWTVGPKAETCDYKDNDCNGKTDDGLVAPGCDKQAGVCQGATEKCGGASGWSSCTDGDYQAYAQSKGQVFETVETKCDGKDNDCNGKTDEPAGCCQPDCSGKACGADDGCGQPCPTGSCVKAQDTCDKGTCVCQPSCSGKICGASDGCGSTCKTGSCSSGLKCISGVCVPSVTMEDTCPPSGPALTTSATIQGQTSKQYIPLAKDKYNIDRICAAGSSPYSQVTALSISAKKKITFLLTPTYGAGVELRSDCATYFWCSLPPYPTSVVVDPGQYMLVVSTNPAGSYTLAVTIADP